MNPTPDNPDNLSDWFAEHYRAATLATRALASAAAQLDGALTTGQAATRNIGIGACLKYEIDAGLLDQLTSFLDGSLTANRTESSTRLAELAASVSAALQFINAHRRAIISSTYHDSAMVIEAMGLLREAATRLEAVIDDCTAQLIERDGT